MVQIWEDRHPHVRVPTMRTGRRQRNRAPIASGPNTFIKKLNQSCTTDSKVLLDAGCKISDSVFMIAQPYHLYVERTDAAKNMARYYAMQISGTLFGGACLTRTWGRIGRNGQSKMHHFEREEEAVDLFLDVMRRKRARGYRPCQTEKSRPA